MVILDNNANTLNEKYLILCRQNALNPSVLRDIVYLRSKGFNNTTIANRIGVHRLTVQNYVEKLRNMEAEDFGKILLGALAIVGGAYLLSKLRRCVYGQGVKVAAANL